MNTYQNITNAVSASRSAVFFFRVTRLVPGRPPGDIVFKRYSRPRSLSTPRITSLRGRLYSTASIIETDRQQDWLCSHEVWAFVGKPRYLLGGLQPLVIGGIRGYIANLHLEVKNRRGNTSEKRTS